MVQGGQFPCQCQPYAVRLSATPVASGVEAVEYPLLFFGRYADTLVLYGEYHVFFCSVLPYFHDEIDIFSTWRVFDGIGKQVVEYLVCFVKIQCAPAFAFRNSEVQPYAFLFSQRPEMVGTQLTGESEDVAFFGAKYHVAVLGLTEIQNLFQQAFQSVNVVAQHRGLAFLGRILPFPVVTYAGYHAERCKQVVGDVGEIIQFGLCQGFLEL